MANVDVLIKIFYDLKEPLKTRIQTNIKLEELGGLLEAYLSIQIGKGKDDRGATKKENYEIVIGLDMSDDTFYTKSDTGNKGLTCGIIMEVFKNLDKLNIEKLQ